MTMKLVCYSSLVAALFLSAGSAWAQGTQEATAQEPTYIARDQRELPAKLMLSDIKGARRQITQFKGKVVVVNFWATWCVPCQVEMPEFTKVYAAYRDRGVEFIGAANEPRSSRPKVEDFMRKHEVQFPVWLEASEKDLATFRVGTGLPGTVILDTEGRVAVRIIGATDGQHLRELLDRVLAEKS
jgi:thiol-disulfide isomerase/thioredoxin